MGPHIRGSQATNGPRMGWVAEMGMNEIDMSEVIG